MTNETAIQKVEPLLTPREQEQLDEWRAKPNFPLALSTSLKLYELFLEGYDCEQIVKTIDGKFDIGTVLDARLRHDWDGRRDAHLASLYSNVVEKVKKTQAEGAMFLADLLAAAHKLHGGKIRKYLQSGDEKDLGEFRIGSIEGYKKVAEILLRMTGQDGGNSKGTKVQVLAQGPVMVSGSNENSKQADYAEQLLSLLAAGKEKK